ncbi:hypothetical protein HDA32_004796 [Spinactinospora alkalitolerans]|uniref:Uncharacterized protein n=1 Tax=Spinactinospora alkalitolerans TaxID=687207 RepID=A0A852TYP2_9ACTN|nr:hypothetical protein [Spinactinospora alkalitolerans]NYE49676.1 hypothetical protein [Spinactinospora alkalitolerans]
MLELRFRESGAEFAEEADAGLALRSRGEGAETVPVPRVRREGGRLRAELDELPLADGVWDVVFVRADGRTEPVATADPGFSLRERSAYLAEPRQRELRVVRTPEGRLRLRAASVLPYAEVERIDIDETEITVSGVPAYVPRRPGRQEAQLVVRQRKRSGVVTVEAELADAAFRCRIPLAPMSEAHDFDRAHNEWDLWLRTPLADAELRLASRADDIVGKKKRFTFPAAVLGGAERRVRIRPYYTVDDDLSLLATDARGDKAQGAHE